VKDLDLALVAIVAGLAIYALRRPAQVVLSPGGLTVSPQGVDFIKSWEGLRLMPYRDAANHWTVGYGHTGPDVRPGEPITQEEAELLLKQDLAKFAACVNGAVRVPLTQAQFDALVSFAFNVGCGAFQESTLLRKLNAGDYLGAADQFPRWVKAGGRTIRGLVRRREAERHLFLTGEYLTA